jgi:NADH-quinone oxidoreductase subunit L
LYFSIFWNRPSSVTHHSKEGGPATVLPLMILAAGAMSAGFIPFSHFVTSDGVPFESHLHFAFSIAPVLTGLAGILIAAWMYLRQGDLPQRMATALNGLHTSALNKFYIDEVYLFVTQKVLFNLIGRPAAWFDRHIVDGLVNLTGNATVDLSGKVKALQSGRVQQYAFVFLGGLLLLLIMVVYLMN